MNPLLTNRLDPALRSAERRESNYEPPPRRRRPPSTPKAAAADDTAEPAEHKLDELA